jgi:hypothetical protein
VRGDSAERIFRDYMGSCEEAHDLKVLEAEGVLARTLLSIHSVVKLAHFVDMDYFYRHVAAQTISRWPTPLLGALEGCISASLLAPFCKRHVERVASSAKLDKEMIERRAEKVRDLKRVWCLLAGDPLDAQKKRSLGTAAPPPATPSRDHRQITGMADPGL